MTAPLSDDERAELEFLRRRVTELEDEHARQLARLNAALGAAQERLYWLDRWQVDLNALMARPGAEEVRALARAARRPVRLYKRVKWRFR